MCGPRGIKITHVKGNEIISITWIRRSMKNVFDLMRDLSATGVGQANKAAKPALAIADQSRRHFFSNTTRIQTRAQFRHGNRSYG